jgi:hypothetical protein
MGSTKPNEKSKRGYKKRAERTIISKISYNNDNKKK